MIIKLMMTVILFEMTFFTESTDPFANMDVPVAVQEQAADEIEDGSFSGLEINDSMDVELETDEVFVID